MKKNPILDFFRDVNSVRATEQNRFHAVGSHQDLKLCNYKTATTALFKYKTASTAPFYNCIVLDVSFLSIA